MNLMTKFSNGWTIVTTSFKVLKENRQLLIFPVLSGISIIAILASFFVAFLGLSGWQLDQLSAPGKLMNYAILFFFYITNYFVIVFFNMALVHCTSLYFKGEEVTVQKGIDFSMSRIGSILGWAIFAGLIGGILKIIQENVGSLGKIITGLVGIVWSIATFFVVPVIAYEDLGPVAAFKKSAMLMKEKWGESIGAGFSFGLIQLSGIAVIALVAFAVAAINTIAGIAIGILLFLLMSVMISTVKTIFISAIYHNITGDPVELYNQQFIDNLFEAKRK
ncbi:MAG: hypothetical protein KGM16_10125 [Bacteroidota bacterium]|nr:hypothetical protein [Bacteroidota bacterium]